MNLPESPLELLYRAWNAPLGIIIETTDLDGFRQKLYAARKKAGDPDLDTIAICVSPTAPETQLWLVRKDSANAALRPDSSEGDDEPSPR